MTKQKMALNCWFIYDMAEKVKADSRIVSGMRFTLIVAWKQITVREPLRNMAIVYDFDCDGSLDAISVGWTNPKIRIYENLKV